MEIDVGYKYPTYDGFFNNISLGFGTSSPAYGFIATAAQSADVSSDWRQLRWCSQNVRVNHPPR